MLLALAVARLDSGSKNIAALGVPPAILLMWPNGLFGSLVEECEGR